MRSKIRFNDTRGFVLITMGASLTVFLSFMALVVDFGRLYVTKAQLQNTADAAALAAAIDIPLGTAVAGQHALDFGGSHYVAGAPISVTADDVIFGNYNFSTRSFTPETNPVNSVAVTARRTADSVSGPLPLFFAPLFGHLTSDVRARSVAALDPHVVGVQSKNRLIPYSAHESVVDANGDGKFDIGSVINIHPRDDAPGNFGFLDLDGGSNDTPELRRYIEEGYDDDFIIPPGGSVSVSGSTGIEGNSLLNSFDSILDEVVFLPVHDAVVDPGSNAVFNVTGLLAVRIQSVKLTGSSHSRYIRVKIISYASSVLATHPDAPANNSVAKPRLVQ